VPTAEATLTILTPRAPLLPLAPVCDLPEYAFAQHRPSGAWRLAGFASALFSPWVYSAARLRPHVKIKNVALDIVRQGELLLEQRIKLLPGIFRAGLAAIDEVDCRARFEVVAEVRFLLIGNQFRLRFGALLALGGVEKAAVAAAMKVRSAGVAGIAALDLDAGRRLELGPATLAVQRYTVHNTCKVTPT